MSDRFHPLSMEQLTDWVFDELERHESLFGIPRAGFFVPRRGRPLPPAAAAGGCSRRRSAWPPARTRSWPRTSSPPGSAGARFIELKTVQTLDELDVHKPCIDVPDEGYNVEWSQELSSSESFDEYLRAWVLIHALAPPPGIARPAPGRHLQHERRLRPGRASGGPTCSGSSTPWPTPRRTSPAYVDIVARRYPAVRDIDIPARISDKRDPLDDARLPARRDREHRRATCSSSAGCTPRSSATPRCSARSAVRRILNDELGYREVTIPDEAFGHDLRWDGRRAHVPGAGAGRGRAGRTFGLKLSNTLEVAQLAHASSPAEPTMYLSGRALHRGHREPRRHGRRDLRGPAALSFAGGADCFNAADLLAAGDAHRDRLLRPPQDRRLPAPAPVRRASSRRHGRRRRDRPARPRGAQRRRPRSARWRRYAERTRRDWRYQKGILPHGPLEDAAGARALRLHRGALRRRVPGRPEGARSTWRPCGRATAWRSRG